uniref:Uncharacterized protein n=1 Tax=Rousettus aegyptiacus TaxID=9407 RepID=A0A7J8C2C1_ROUAE|nr:hypothetical protein HJG63_009306 [Rousettus aegyptiacus]
MRRVGLQISRMCSKRSCEHAARWRPPTSQEESPQNEIYLARTLSWASHPPELIVLNVVENRLRMGKAEAGRVFLNPKCIKETAKLILWSLLDLASWQLSSVWAQTNSYKKTSTGLDVSDVNGDKPFIQRWDLMQAPRTRLWCTSWLWTRNCVLTCVEQLNEGVCGQQDGTQALRGFRRT